MLHILNFKKMIFSIFIDIKYYSISKNKFKNDLQLRYLNFTNPKTLIDQFWK